MTDINEKRGVIGCEITQNNSLEFAAIGKIVQNLMISPENFD